MTTISTIALFAVLTIGGITLASTTAKAPTDNCAVVTNQNGEWLCVSADYQVTVIAKEAQ